MKNVIALAAGIADGLGYGDNTKAALITRGIAEIARLGVKMGGKIETFTGLTGIGNLIILCQRPQQKPETGYLIGQEDQMRKQWMKFRWLLKAFIRQGSGKLAKKHDVPCRSWKKSMKVLLKGNHRRKLWMTLM